MLWADMCLGKHKIGYKLSNSGDSLKLLIPSDNWKIICGWSNYSDKVTSQKINENEVGYRGSKSNLNRFVKEQRVDGSWLLCKKAVPYRSLRYTLMDFERNYQLRTQTNQLINRFFSTIPNNSPLNSWFITGFSDAEASFIISIYNDKKKKD